jgi:hypothetical protein
MELLIEPHDGIGFIKLGMEKSEVRQLLLEHYTISQGASDFYFDSCLQIEFENDCADFIGISYNLAFKVRYKNINVFNIDASKLFELIASSESQAHKFNECEYIFPDQVITLYDSDFQYDYSGNFKRMVWAQIGIGTKSYLRAVNGV